ncbi:hypothetical protein DGG96_14570 [Legionella qingyii]|uniref:Uncharacterized protein n=1 Tax=Legionella qingyii TaxID=2184757 RepID=A0A317U118_9GAMM|nr:hypothetical protein DGG96_14570 [Legionella qingyii]
MGHCGADLLVFQVLNFGEADFGRNCVGLTPHYQVVLDVIPHLTLDFIDWEDGFTVRLDVTIFYFHVTVKIAQRLIIRVRVFVEPRGSILTGLIRNSRVDSVLGRTIILVDSGTYSDCVIGISKATVNPTNLRCLSGQVVSNASANCVVVTLYRNVVFLVIMDLTD